MEDYKKHLECCIEYWEMIATVEKREGKSIELQEIIKDIENRIHNLEGDKR